MFISAYDPGAFARKQSETHSLSQSAVPDSATFAAGNSDDLGYSRLFFGTFRFNSSRRSGIVGGARRCSASLLIVASVA